MTTPPGHDPRRGAAGGGPAPTRRAGEGEGYSAFRRALQLVLMERQWLLGDLGLQGGMCDKYFALDSREPFDVYARALHP